MINKNLDEVADIGSKLVPGGYICQIKTVELVPEKEYVKVTYDIVDGQYKDYGADMMERTGYPTPLRFIKSYKDSALKFFKYFIHCICESNPGYEWKGDERTLVGKYIGILICDEHYEGRDGKMKTRPYAADFVGTHDITSGNFKIPEDRWKDQMAPDLAF